MPVHQQEPVAASVRTRRSAHCASIPYQRYVVPDSVMVCGLFSTVGLALSLIVKVPVKVPLFVGANLTLMTHIPAGWTVAPMQVEVPVTTVKSPLPLIAGVPKISCDFPLFVTVIDTVLVLLTGVVGKVSLPELRPLALKLASGSMTRAVSGNECGFPAAVSAIMKVAVEAIGLKMFTVGWMPTPIVQLFPAGNVAGSFSIIGGQRVMLAVK